MNSLLYLVWLAKMALEFATYAWFVSVPLVVLCLFATAYGLRTIDKERKRRLWLIGALYAFPVLTLAVGTVFRQYGADWPSYLLFGLLIALVALGVYFVVRMRGLRFVFAAHLLVAVWFSLCSGAVAGMAITDKWL